MKTMPNSVYVKNFILKIFPNKTVINDAKNAKKSEVKNQLVQ